MDRVAALAACLIRCWTRREEGGYHGGMSSASPPPANPARSRLLSGLALLVVLCCYQINLGSPGLWGDEADTGNFARHVLRSGLPRALLPERSPLIYGDCVQLGAGFLSRRLPWAQYYLGAASIALFGDHPAGLRRLFALCGALALLPLAALARRRAVSGVSAVLVPLLCLLHPQVLLLARQARYFPLLLLLSPMLLWLVLAAGDPGGSRRRQVTLGGAAALCALLLFHSHPLAALAQVLALSLYCARCQRQSLRLALLCAALGLGSYAAFALALPALPTALPAHLSGLLADPAAFLLKSLRAVLAHLRDLDYVGVTPLLLWPPLLFVALRRRGAAAGEPLVALVLLLLACHTLGSALAIGTEGTPRYAPLRYAAHLLPLLLLAGYLALEEALRWGMRGSGSADENAERRARWALPLFLVPLLLTPCGASYWYPGPLRRPLPLSFWPVTYAELLAAPADDWQTIDAALRQAAPAEGPAPLLFVRPEGNNDVLIYYSGDRVLVTPDVFPGSACSALLAQELGPRWWSRLRRRPELVLVLGPAAAPPPGFVARPPLTLLRGGPDAARPELTRRVFLGPLAPPPPATPVVLLQASARAR